MILFDKYPYLQSSISHTRLTKLPSPTHSVECPVLSQSMASLHVKDDSMLGSVYGGNKVRKLEFILAKAKQQQAQTVLTFGGAGSNHALATALYAKQLGMKCVSVLSTQVNSRAVQRNLLAHIGAGTDLRHFDTWEAAQASVSSICAEYTSMEGSLPFIIPPGGSSSEGGLGFVEAGLEIAAQIESGIIPYTHYIYVACGTMGTCTGLLLGLALAGINTQLIAVQVTSPDYCTLERCTKTYYQTGQLLEKAGFPDPIPEFPEDRLTLRDDQFGEEYGRYTEQACAAVARARERGYSLECTYTGKALAALLSDMVSGHLNGAHVLFWNTYNAHGIQSSGEHVEYKALPKEFHMYFETDTQPLDS